MFYYSPIKYFIIFLNIFYLIKFNFIEIGLKCDNVIKILLKSYNLIGI